MPTLAKIPTTVFTGFLGAGKSSLIQNLLRDAGGRRLALIINEFGDIGVDRELLLGCGDANCAEDDIVELANGCICCTVADDFVPTMQRLLARVPPPEHIVIETSGLALPKPLLKAFQWPEIRTRVTVDGVIAVVDAAAVRDGVFASAPAALEAQRAADPALDHDSPLEELFEEQLGAADLVVLNKADLLATEDWPAVEDRVRVELRPGVGVVRAAAALPADVLIGLGAAAESDLASRPSHHDDDEDHEHDDFESFHVDVPALDDPEGFVASVRGTVGQHAVLRLKGFLAVRGRPMRLVLQGVGDRIQHYFDRPWGPDEARAGRLVVIGERGLDREAIAAALQAQSNSR
jgi:cobalamin biosynthesis protein CobW